MYVPKPHPQTYTVCGKHNNHTQTNGWLEKKTGCQRAEFITRERASQDNMDVDWKDYKNWQQARQRRECQTSGYQTVRIFTRQSASQDSINLEGLDDWQQARHRRGCQTTSKKFYDLSWCLKLRFDFGTTYIGSFGQGRFQVVELRIEVVSCECKVGVVSCKLHTGFCTDRRGGRDRQGQQKLGLVYRL